MSKPKLLNPNLPYRGRFAPSPTGPLHFGSMIAAIASFLQARARQGKWLVRMEDIDPPREMPGAADDILRTLELFRLEWDEAVRYQSQRSEAYIDALEQLRHDQVLYPCGCTRKEIAATQRSGQFGLVYSGHCRNGLAPDRRARALRVLTHNESIGFTDLIQGPYAQTLEQEVGDFVVRRADGLFAYQLAVVVDDADQQITEIVRGCDLLDNTPRQIYLQQLLGYPTPSYAHLPVALATDGQKLSKQTGAKAIASERPQAVAMRILALLNQSPPPELIDATMEELWQWAIGNWRLEAIEPVNVTVSDASYFQ